MRSEAGKRRSPCGTIFFTAVLAVAMAFATAAATGADWKPERNIEIVVGTGPGGGQDKTARTLQRILQEHKLVPAPVTVVNKPGGGGAVGWTYLNQHAGDAHHIEIGNPTLLTNQIVGRSAVSYTDVTPIAILFTESVAFSVRADSPIASGRDLVERLRKYPASVSFSVGSSLGSANHIAMGEVTRLAGGDPRRLKAVVFQGGGEAITALLGGHVDLIASAANNVVNLVAAGKIRVLGVTSPQRLTGALAAVPTWREQGIDVTVNNWRMVAGPRGLAPAQLAYWQAVLAQATDTEEWRRDLERNAFENIFVTGEGAQRFLQSQYETLRGALAQIGMAKP